MSHRYIALLIAVIFVLLNLIGLDRSPPVHYDDAFLNDPARILASENVLRSAITDVYQMDKGYFFLPPVHPIITAAVYKLFGFGIWQTRVPVLLFGSGILFLVYLLTVRLFKDPRAGLFAAALLALDPEFIEHARTPRMDTICIFLALLGVYLALHANEQIRRRYAWYALAGLTIGLSVMTHLVAISWALAAGLAILFWSKEDRIKSGVVFGLAALLPSLIWFGVGLRTPSVFWEQVLVHVQLHGPERSVWEAFVGELRGYIGYPVNYSRVPLLLLVYLAGMIWLVWRAPYTKKAKGQWLLFFLTTFLFNALILTDSDGAPIHPIMMSAIAGGCLLAALLPTLRITSWQPLRLAAAGFTLLLFANLVVAGIGARYMTLIYWWQARNYQPVTEFIQEHIEPGSTTTGPSEVWYALAETDITLRWEIKPDPQVHDYAIVRVVGAVEPLEGFEYVAELDRQLPEIPVVGSFVSGSGAYHLQVWRSQVE